jgi:hypothetical protein
MGRSAPCLCHKHMGGFRAPCALNGTPLRQVRDCPFSMSAHKSLTLQGRGRLKMLMLFNTTRECRGIATDGGRWSLHRPGRAMALFWRQIVSVLPTDNPFGDCRREVTTGEGHMDRVCKGVPAKRSGITVQHAFFAVHDQV